MTGRFKILLALVPAAAVAVLFELFVGHRHDYTGHYLAGYGGTLAAAMVWMRQLSPAAFGRWSVVGIVPGCLVCIGLGAITEATIFRLAKFDELDFCNQSLGAVLASCVALGYAAAAKPPDWQLDIATIVGIAFLGAGGVFAFA